MDELNETSGGQVFNLSINVLKNMINALSCIRHRRQVKEACYFLPP
jgi:hypothetical protein